MAELNLFKVLVSDDGVKRDPELHCAMCGAHLCDIEHDDTLETLISVADNHVCDRDAKPYTVVGFYHDNSQPFVANVSAVSPQEAAAAAQYEAQEAGTLLAVVEVFEGHHQGKLDNEEVV